MLNYKLVVERTLHVETPRGLALLSVGDEVFLKLHGYGSQARLRTGAAISHRIRVRPTSRSTPADTAAQTYPAPAAHRSCCRQKVLQWPLQTPIPTRSITRTRAGIWY